MSDKPREWTVKWDREYQYSDGVPADIQVATGAEVDEHEKVRVIEYSAYEAAIKERDWFKLNSEMAHCENEQSIKERDDLKKLYDGAVIVTEQARMSEKRQEHIAVKFAVERDTYKELAIDYKSGLAFERARSAKLVRALEAIEQAEIWTAMRDEHRYSGIDAGYATEARETLAEYETASHTESAKETK